MCEILYKLIMKQKEVMMSQKIILQEYQKRWSNFPSVEDPQHLRFLYL